MLQWRIVVALGGEAPWKTYETTSKQAKLTRHLPGHMLSLLWVKASYRWSGYDFGLGGEEFGSG